MAPAGAFIESTNAHYCVEHDLPLGARYHRRPCGLVDQPEIVGGSHLGFLAQELEENRHVAYGLLPFIPLREKDDAPLVAADGKGGRLDELALTEALMQAVPDDLKGVRAASRLQGAPRLRPHRRPHQILLWDDDDDAIATS